jgi:hypothetical protein
MLAEVMHVTHTHLGYAALHDFRDFVPEVLSVRLRLRYRGPIIADMFVFA